MFKKGDKFPFIIRTIAVMAAIYLSVMLAGTWFVYQNQVEQASDKTEKQFEEIKNDLKACADINIHSAAYADGINTAQAAATLRYYKYKLFKECSKYGGQVDLTLYKIKKKGSKVISLSQFVPNTPILIGSPLYRNSKIVVFADSVDEVQLKQLTNAYKNATDTTWTGNAKGYQEGRFFYLSSVKMEEPDMDPVTLTSDIKRPNGKYVETSFQDYRILLPDGTVIGAYGKETAMDQSFHKEIARDVKDDILNSEYVDGAVSAGNGSVTSFSFRENLSDNYCLDLTTSIDPWAYIFKNMIPFYLFSLLIFLILSDILLRGHNKIIESKFESERRRRLMSDSMAHELKNPLGIIHNCGEFLMEEQDPDKRQKYTQAIIDESQYMNEAVVSMLDLSKMEAGTYPLELNEFNIDDVIRPLIGRCRPLLADKKLQIKYTCDADHSVYADKKLFSIAVSNFLSNAIRHAAFESVITLSVQYSQNSLCVSAHNEGSKIEEADIRKIWDAYYYGNNKQGNGLGLAIVRNACLLHGGSYGSVNENGGVTFWAEFPSQENRVSHIAAATGPIINVTNHKNNLHGLLAIAAGTIVQGLFGILPFENGISGLLSGSFDFVFVPSQFDISSLVGMFFGSALILIGALRLKKAQPKARRIRDLAILTMLSELTGIILLWIVLMNGISLKVQLDLDAYSSELFIICILYIVTAVVVPVIICLVFSICRTATEEMGNRTIFANTKYGMILLIFAMGILYIIGASILSDLIALSIPDITWFAVCVASAISWINVYRKCH